MDNTKAPPTHLWSGGNIPRQITQDGRTNLHHRCVRCGRDFAQALDGSGLARRLTSALSESSFSLRT
jgi:hypothetical protein